MQTLFSWLSSRRIQYLAGGLAIFFALFLILRILFYFGFSGISGQTSVSTADILNTFSIGVRFDLRVAIFLMLIPALLLAIITTVTKIFTGGWAARRAGVAKLGQIRAGTALVARGEFSIIIAGLGVSSGAVPAQLAALATAYVMLLAIMGPIIARFAEPLAQKVGYGRPRATGKKAPG